MSTIRVDELRALSDQNFTIQVDSSDNFQVSGTIEMASGGQFSVPAGTNAQRPSTPVAGMLRYNTESGSLEFYDGSSWQNFISGSAVNNGATEQTAVTSVQALYDAGQNTDGLYWMNLDGTARQYFVPLLSHPYYIMVANWGGGANAFLQNASALTGRELDGQGTLTPEGNWANNGTYGYYRNAGGSDYKYASFSNRGLAYRYVKFKFHLYNYYSNDGVNGRSFLGLGGVGDGLTIMRDNNGIGNSQHIFTYFTAISNNDGNSCPSTAGTYPTHRGQGNNPSGFLGNRYSCFSRQGSSYTSEYVRNFDPRPGDSSGNTEPNSYTGNQWYTIDIGTQVSDPFHCVIHSDQDSGNEDTYLKRGVVLIKA